jgi:mRNA-degrading endonuclease RelE of RelBE toxin-antitoxin system
MPLAILVTPSFARAVKKLHSKDKAILDENVKAVANEYTIGEEKRGDLNGVFVHKFKLNNRETLLAYRLQPDKFNPQALILLAVGSHENFYVQLKR